MARNGDGVFKRRGIWAFKYQDAAGQWREKSTGERSFARAREIRREFLERVRAGQIPTDLASATLEQALQLRYEFVEATASKNSHAPARTAIRHLCRILDPKRRLNTIKFLDIQRYQITRSKEQTRGKKTSPKTINNELLHLIAIFKQAKLWRAMEDDYRPLKVPKRGPGKALSPNDAEHLFRVASERDCWLVAYLCGLVAYAAGCRSYEIKSLQLGDIDLVRQCITIQRDKTKTDAGAREVSLGPIAEAAVRKLLERANVLGAAEPHHYLLPANLSKHTKESDPLRGSKGFDPTRHMSSWSSAWQSLKKHAGMEKFRFHDFRHTYITQAVENGVPLEVMQSQVGHISPEMVRHYTHLSSGAKIAAAQKVADINPGLLALINRGRSGEHIEGGKSEQERPTESTLPTRRPMATAILPARTARVG